MDYRALDCFRYRRPFGRYYGLGCNVSAMVSPILNLKLSGLADLSISGFHRTYTERHIDRVPMNPLSLAPERGGKKNLKKVEYLLSAEQDEEHLSLKGKPRLVIVGGGWAAVGILKKLSVFSISSERT